MSTPAITPTQMTPEEFAASVRTKYPGAYDHVPDADLVQKIVAKYPSYASMIQTRPLTSGAGGTWEQQPSAGARLVKNFGEQFKAVATNPMGLLTPTNLPAAKLDESGNLLPMSQQSPMPGGQTFQGMGQDIKQFGQSLVPVNQMLQGDIAGGLGKTIANVLMMGSANRAMGGATSVLPKEPTLLDPQRGQPLPPEIQANNLTRAINPVAAERPQLTQNLLDHTGNALEYASRNKIALDTPQAFAKAARGAGLEAKDFYETKILKPNENIKAEVPGEFAPKYRGGFPWMTLKEINDRVAQINTLLEPAWTKTDAGMVRVALANEADLVREGAALRPILYNELSKQTGLTPADIQGIRQRYGSLKNIADTTEAAINRRQASADMTAEGRAAVPLSKVAMATYAVAKSLGLSPENIATKRIMKAISDVTIPAEPLPQIQPPISFNIGKP